MALLMIEDFSAGINRVTYGLEKRPDYAWDMRNFDLDQYGRLVKRNGYTRFTATALPNNATPHSLMSYYNEVANIRMVVIVLSDNGLHGRMANDTAVTFSAPGFVTTRDIQGAVLRSYLVFTLGNQNIRLLLQNVGTGAHLPPGVAGPSFTPTFTATTGGSLNTASWYRYRFTYASRFPISGLAPLISIESVPRMTTKTNTTLDVQLTGINNAVNITGLAASSETIVDNIRIYRSNGQQTRDALDTVETYFVAQQDDATTSYLDTTADSALGGLLDTYNHNRLGIDTGTSTNRLRAVASFHNRIFISKDIESVIYFSKRMTQDNYLGVVGDAVPYAFPAENSIFVGAGDGDDITAMTVLHGQLLIFKRYSIWVLSETNDVGNPPADATVRQLIGDIGCYADKSLINTGNFVTFLSHRGIYSFDGSNLAFIGEAVQPLIELVSQSNLMLAVGTFIDRKNEYWLSINDSEIASTEERILVYDFHRRYWRSYVLPNTISSFTILHLQSTTDAPLILAGSDNEPRIYRMLDGTTDTATGVATEITARWQSHYLPLLIYRGQAMLGNRISRKKVREIIINSTLSSDTNLRPRFTNLLESDNGATSTTFTITPNSRTDILSYRVGGLHIGRDIRIRTTMDTRSGDATNTDATLNAIVIDFDDSRTL